MKRIVAGSVVVASLLALLQGCGGGGAAAPGAQVGGKNIATGEQEGGQAVTREAADAFTSAVNEFKKHEEARDWDESACTGVASRFISAGKAQGGSFPAAHYNAGIALLRCGKEDEATSHFDTALSQARDIAAQSSDPKAKSDPEFHQVWVQKALIRYRRGDVAGITEAIDMIRQKGFDPDGSQNVEAFVNLGMLFRERWTKDSGNPATRKKDEFGLEDDLARAQFWLQNALSINDSFMPAYNQLALYYLDKARAVAAKPKKEKPGPKTAAKGKETKADKEKAAANKLKADLQTLELGLLVAEEASRRDPGYAGIWNSQGLILLEMNRTGAATQAFRKATEKDPRFFEGWMNYAAINLAFRGYAEAAKGYQAAAGIRPSDYDAKLGLAVALRGQLDFHLTTKQSMERVLSECSDPDKQGSPKCQDAQGKFPSQIKDHEAKFLDFFKSAVAAYDDAQKLDGGRPEAFFDKALLVEKYKQKAGQASSAQAYDEAANMYSDVSQRFSGNPKFDKLAKDAGSRADEARKSAEFERNAAAPPPGAPPANKT